MSAPDSASTTPPSCEECKQLEKVSQARTRFDDADVDDDEDDDDDEEEEDSGLGGYE